MSILAHLNPFPTRFYQHVLSPASESIIEAERDLGIEAGDKWVPSSPVWEDGALAETKWTYLTGLDDLKKSFMTRLSESDKLYQKGTGKLWPHTVSFPAYEHILHRMEY
jgi:hypothetical protein